MNLKNTLESKKQLIIAEIGQSHDGSLNYVHSFIDAASNAGVDVVKFQAHFAEEESSYEDRFRTFTSYKKETRFEYWKRMQFTNEEWHQIKKHIKQKNMFFSSSVFSNKSIDILNKIGVDIWKIPSGESLDLSLIKEITNKSKKPLFISTGMNYLHEVDKIYNFMKQKKNLFLLMHCVSQYPTNLKNIGLNIIDEYKKKYNCLVGYSDHSGTLEIPLLSLEYNIRALEVHVTFDKNLFNPDSTSSIDFNDLRYLCNFVKLRNYIKQYKLSKNKIAQKLNKNRTLFSKSLALVENMKSGQRIGLKHITLKKPGTGLKWFEKNKIIGKKLIKNKSKNNLIKVSDVKKK